MGGRGSKSRPGGYVVRRSDASFNLRDEFSTEQEAREFMAQNVYGSSWADYSLTAPDGTDITTARAEQAQGKRRAIQQNAVIVSDRPYRDSPAHSGRVPRGNGTWVFAGRSARLGDSGSDTFTTGGSYSSAKKQAVKWAASNGYGVVEVQP